VQKVVDGLNVNLANGTGFMTTVFDARFPLNLTTTQPPSVDTVKKIVTLNFDGTFFDI
jgi:hypothetical protein